VDHVPQSNGVVEQALGAWTKTQRRRCRFAAGRL